MPVYVEKLPAELVLLIRDFALALPTHTFPQRYPTIDDKWRNIFADRRKVALRFCRTNRIFYEAGIQALWYHIIPISAFHWKSLRFLAKKKLTIHTSHLLPGTTFGMLVKCFDAIALDMITSQVAKLEEPPAVACPNVEHFILPCFDDDANLLLGVFRWPRLRCLQNVYIQDNWGVNFGNVLGCLPSLQHLEIGRGATIDVWDILTEMAKLVPPNSGIQYLRLSNPNDWCDFDGLSDFTKSCKTLEFLYLESDDNDLSGDMELFIPHLPPTLKGFQLFTNSIEIINDVSNILTVCPSLRYLHIQWERLGHHFFDKILERHESESDTLFLEELVIKTPLQWTQDTLQHEELSQLLKWNNQAQILKACLMMKDLKARATTPQAWLVKETLLRYVCAATGGEIE